MQREKHGTLDQTELNSPISEKVKIHYFQARKIFFSFSNSEKKRYIESAKIKLVIKRVRHIFILMV